MRNRAKGIIGACLISIFLFSNSIYVNAMSNQKTEIQKEMVNTTKLLEKAISKAYQKVETEVKEEIVDEQYDYYLTMESFNKNTNPYADKNYNQLIVSYLTAKQYVPEANFYSLPFIEYSITKSAAEDGTAYGEVTLQGLSAEDIFATYGLENDEKVKQQYESNLRCINEIVNGYGLAQTNFIQIASSLDEETKSIVTKLSSQEMTDVQKQYISTAISLINRVPYEWGGKPSKKGYDTTWYTIKESGLQKGLDCSGYIQWIYKTAGLDEELTNQLSSTSQMMKLLPEIEREELQIGDLGFLNRGEKINHVGMYLGNGYWIHCSSAKKTVVVEQTEMFQYFAKSPDLITDESNEENIEEIQYYKSENVYTDEEIYLLAQLIVNEANAEGFNGWAAVAEVVRNRVNNSVYFPEATIRDVIYANGQFENSDMIETRVPSEEQIQVAREVMNGNLSIFNNPDVLFFRNANKSTEDWGTYKYYTSINNHQFYVLTEKEN